MPLIHDFNPLAVPVVLDPPAVDEDLDLHVTFYNSDNQRFESVYYKSIQREPLSIRIDLRPRALHDFVLFDNMYFTPLLHETLHTDELIGRRLSIISEPDAETDINSIYSKVWSLSLMPEFSILRYTNNK